MTKRDAIEAMARAMAKRNGATLDAMRPAVANKWVYMAEAGYEAIAEMAKGERKAQSTPSTPGPTGEAVAH